MSDATWKITRKEGRFELAVTARSEHPPETVYQWQGEIEIDESGIQHMNSISLIEAGEANGANEKATPKEITLYKHITHHNNPAVVFTKIAKICDEHTQEMERHRVEREIRDQQAMEQVSTALRRLRQLEEEGIHNVASYEERKEEGAETSKASTDTS